MAKRDSHAGHPSIYRGRTVRPYRTGRDGPSAVHFIFTHNGQRSDMSEHLPVDRPPTKDGPPSLTVKSTRKHTILCNFLYGGGPSAKPGRTVRLNPQGIRPHNQRACNPTRSPVPRQTANGPRLTAAPARGRCYIIRLSLQPPFPDLSLLPSSSPPPRRRGESEQLFEVCPLLLPIFLLPCAALSPPHRRRISPLCCEALCVDGQIGYRMN
nr:unnamed protein product [Digitaria exilis]